MNIHIRRCAVPAVLVLATAATARAQQAIRLTRPVETGFSYHVRATGSTDITTTDESDGQAQNMGTVNMTATLDADAHVLKVDDAGRPVGIAYTINECRMAQHDHAATLIAPGETLIARRGEDGQTRFFVKKKRFTDLERQALESVAGIDVYQATKDDMFGSSTPRAAGEHWPIDGRKFAAEMQRFTASKINPDDVTGTTTFMDVMDYAGMPCQVIRTDIDASGPMPGFDQMPPGMRLKSAHLKATTHDLLPVDTTQPRVADKVHIEFDVAFTGRMAHKSVDARMTGVIESEHTYSPLTAQAAVSPP